MKRQPILSRFQVLDRLRAEIKHIGSARKYAKAINVSPAYISDILRGRRDPGIKVLEPLGCYRVTIGLEYRAPWKPRRPPTPFIPDGEGNTRDL